MAQSRGDKADGSGTCEQCTMSIKGFDNPDMASKRVHEMRLARAQKFEPGERVMWVQVPDFPIPVTIISEKENGSWLVRFDTPLRCFNNVSEVTIDAEALRRLVPNKSAQARAKKGKDAK